MRELIQREEYIGIVVPTGMSFMPDLKYLLKEPAWVVSKNFHNL